MGPLKRDQYVFWIAMMTQNREARESAMAALWSREVNVGARGHDAGYLSLFI